MHMKISDIEIFRSLSRNRLSVTSDPDGIVFNRFTPYQYQAYSSSPQASIRSRCPAGVCLDFLTDSDVVKLEYKYRDFARRWLYFDVYVNDRFVESIGNRFEESGGGSIEIKIPAPESENALRRITIYLPHNVDLAVAHMELADGSVWEPAPEYQGSLLCFGDSITQGMDALRPSSAYPVQLARFFNMNLLNQGVGGQMFNKQHLDPDLPCRPDLVTVAFGTNDWGRHHSIGEFRQSCSEYLGLLAGLYSDADIFVITPLWRGDLHEVKPAGRFFDIADSIRDICRRHPNITVLDGMKLVPNMPGFFKDSTLHPSDEGFMHYSINLIKELRKFRCW